MVSATMYANVSVKLKSLNLYYEIKPILLKLINSAKYTFSLKRFIPDLKHQFIIIHVYVSQFLSPFFQVRLRLHCDVFSLSLRALNSTCVYISWYFLGAGHAVQALEGFFLERFPVVGVGDLDECVSALPQSLAEQMRDAEFGDDVVDVRPAGDDSTTCK